MKGEGMGLEGMEWGWDGKIRDGKGRERMGWVGMGWDGIMGWDGLGRMGWEGWVWRNGMEWFGLGGRDRTSSMHSLVASVIESRMIEWRVRLLWKASFPPLRMRPFPDLMAS